MQYLLPDVKIDQFEGPYDLLLELAKKEKVNLSEISLSSLTKSFIAYMENSKIPAEIIASFVIVAATLVLLKARRAIPKLNAEEDEELDTFQERIALYQKYRDAAELLGITWNKHPLLASHFFAEGEYTLSQEHIPMPDVSPELLADAMRICIGKIPPPPNVRAHITKRGRSLSDLLTMFQERISRLKTITFQDTVRGSHPQEQAVSFLAVLEMARSGEVTLEQDEALGTLTLHKV